MLYLADSIHPSLEVTASTGHSTVLDWHALPPLQVYLLNRRFQQHQQIIWQGHGGVQDRTIYEDSVFARVLKESGMMEEREYETYVSLFSNMSNFM